MAAGDEDWVHVTEEENDCDDESYCSSYADGGGAMDDDDGSWTEVVVNDDDDADGSTEEHVVAGNNKDAPDEDGGDHVDSTAAACSVSEAPAAAAGDDVVTIIGDDVDCEETETAAVADEEREFIGYGCEATNGSDDGGYNCYDYDFFDYMYGGVYGNDNDNSNDDGFVMNGEVNNGDHDQPTDYAIHGNNGEAFDRYNNDGDGSFSDVNDDDGAQLTADDEAYHHDYGYVDDGYVMNCNGDAYAAAAYHGYGYGAYDDAYYYATHGHGYYGAGYADGYSAASYGPAAYGYYYGGYYSPASAYGYGYGYAPVYMQQVPAGYDPYTALDVRLRGLSLSPPGFAPPPQAQGGPDP